MRRRDRLPRARPPMTAAEVVGLLWLLGAVVPIATVAWLVAEPPGAVPGPSNGAAATGLTPDLVLHLLLFVPLAFVGASLAVRPHPAPIAWLMLSVAALNGIAWFGRTYATHALVAPDSLPGAELTAVLTIGEQLAHFLVGALGVVMVRSGHLPAGRARWLAVPPLVVGGAGALSALLAPGPLPAFPYVVNPLGVDGAARDVLAAIGHPELWPAALIPPAAWLVAVARSEPSPGRRRVLRLVGVMAPVPSLAILGLTEVGGEQWFWAVTLLFALLLVNVTIVAARRERLWGMPALVHRTVLWVVLSTLAATVSAFVLFVEAQVGLDGPLELAVGLGLALGLTSMAHAALDAGLRRRLIGEGGDALRALARLEDQLHHVEAGRPAPEVLAGAAASAVRGAVAVVEVLVSGRRRRVAGPDAPLEERLTLPVVHAGQAVGFLTIGLGDGEVLGEPERELLEELAAAAAPAIDEERLRLELFEQHELSDSLAALERERVARVLEDRLVTRLEGLAADLGRVDGLAERAGRRRIDLAHDAAGEMVDDVRSLAHALARPAGAPGS